MLVVVTGSRSWRNRQKIKRALSRLPKKSIVVQGGARGADTIAKEVALELGLSVKTKYANWDKYGLAAGFIRNEKMIAMKPDLVVAFWDGESHGTEHTIKKAREKNIQVEIHYP